MLIRVLLSIFLLIITSLLVYLLYLQQKRRRYNHIKSPPLPSLYHPLSYFFGHIHFVRKLREENPSWTFVDVCGHLFKTLDTKTMAIHFYNRCLIFTIDMNKVPIVLSDHDIYKKPKFTRSALDHLGGTRFMGKLGILTNIGDEVWYKKRKILDAAFHKKFLKVTFDGMLYVTNKVVDHIEDNYTEDVVLDIYPILGRTALEVVCRSGFSIDEDMIEQEKSHFVDAVSFTFKTLGLFFRNSFTFNMPWYFRSEKNDVKQYLGGLRKYLSKHAMSRITNEDGNLHSGDILSYIIKANSYDDKFTVEDIVDEFLTFFVAGMETTSNTMSFFIHNMLKHPHVYSKVIDEVDRVFDDREDLEFDDLNDLVYLEQALKESMRIMTVVEGTGRFINKDITLDGVFLPKGTTINIQQSLVHIDPDNWAEPLVYNPDRFSSGKPIKAFTFMPFMAGPRSCIGKHFAMLEMKIVLSKLIKRFEFIDPNPDVAVCAVVSDITRKPKDGMPVLIKLR